MNVAAARQPAAEWKQEDAPPPDDGERVNILIVDDLPENQMVYRSILEESGQNLMTARSGEDALKLVLQHEFAVILLDVNMPGMNGFEIATLIRSRKKSSRTPIIFLTAFTDEVRMAQGYASGAVDYLPTPVVPEIFKAKVRVFIELSQMRRQAASQAEERARRTAAEEADRRKDEFLGMLAHELRNPLGPILNAAHLLRRIAAGEPRLEEVGGIVDRQVKHMTRLIDDLLDATRLAHGKVLLKKERCDLAQIVRQTAEDYRSIFDASGQQLEIDVPAMFRSGWKAIRRGWCRPSAICCITPINSPIPAAWSRYASIITKKTISPPSQSPTPASASIPECCRMFSTCSARPTRDWTAAAAGWASGWRWSRDWWNCTAAMSAPQAPGRVKARHFTIRLPVESVPAAIAAAAEKTTSRRNEIPHPADRGQPAYR